MENKNIYQKLNDAREYVLANIGKKSGKNAFQKFDYFELADIVPVVQKAEKENGLCSFVSIGKDEAKITLVDNDTMIEKIELSIPVSQLTELDKLNPAQREQHFGAISTYSRRYLLMQLYQIVELDQIDSKDNSSKPNNKKTYQPTNSKPNYFVSPKTGKAWGIMSNDELKKWVERMNASAEKNDLVPWIAEAEAELNRRGNDDFIQGLF